MRKEKEKEKERERKKTNVVVNHTFTNAITEGSSNRQTYRQTGRLPDR